MSPRKTDTGKVFEQMMPPALKRGGYAIEEQKHVGTRFGTGKHYIDWHVTKDGKNILISNKWQEVSGTAEQKVPFEVMCLQDAIRQGKGDRAYLVLGGPGWKLRDFFVKSLDQYLAMPNVKVMTLEDFIAKANSGKL